MTEWCLLFIGHYKINIYDHFIQIHDKTKCLGVFSHKNLLVDLLLRNETKIFNNFIWKPFLSELYCYSGTESNEKWWKMPRLAYGLSVSAPSRDSCALHVDAQRVAILKEKHCHVWLKAFDDHKPWICDIKSSHSQRKNNHKKHFVKSNNQTRSKRKGKIYVPGFIVFWDFCLLCQQKSDLKRCIWEITERISYKSSLWRY